MKQNIGFPLLRVVAIGYILYLLFDIISGYFAGGADAPGLTLVLISTVLLGGGCIWIAVITWKDYKKKQEEKKEEQAPLGN